MVIEEGFVHPKSYRSSIHQLKTPGGITYFYTLFINRKLNKTPAYLKYEP
jgi:hypothetical protein